VALREKAGAFAQQPTSPEVIEPSQCANKPISGHQFHQELLPPLKFFLQKRLPQKGYPLSGAETVFGQVFGRGGISNFQNPKIPPTGGVASAARLLFP
jgi:hypothetical protein